MLKGKVKGTHWICNLCGLIHKVSVEKCSCGAIAWISGIFMHFINEEALKKWVALSTKYMGMNVRIAEEK